MPDAKKVTRGTVVAREGTQVGGQYGGTIHAVPTQASPTHGASNVVSPSVVGRGLIQAGRVGYHHHIGK